jgi:hypothetical protein
MPTLFEQVVGASGLSEVLAPGTIQRACERAGVADPAHLTRVELLRALPEIEIALKTFFQPYEVKERVAALLLLTRSFSGFSQITADLKKPTD